MLLSLCITNVGMEATAGVTTEVVATPTVSGGQGFLRINCPADGVVYHFQIYSITGRLEKTFSLRDGSQTVDLPQGCYIVRCEKWSKKVIVN